MNPVSRTEGEGGGDCDKVLTVEYYTADIVPDIAYKKVISHILQQVKSDLLPFLTCFRYQKDSSVTGCCKSSCSIGNCPYGFIAGIYRFMPPVTIGGYKDLSIFTSGNKPLPGIDNILKIFLGDRSDTVSLASVSGYQYLTVITHGYQ